MSNSTAAVLKRAICSVEARVNKSAASDRELILRFAQENDQAAFATLVRRYSGMVLGVCRRGLANVQDAEDACQATFLVLARKAATGQWSNSVANWLYTTARKIAANARRAAQRRARRESKAAVLDRVQTADQTTGRELLAALDEELDKLAARYREPLVLCYLEGLTRDEVASRLGVPAGTVKIQLERGRKKLGDALTRRGCGLGAGLLALAVTSPARASSPRMIEAVLAAMSGSPPAAVAALAKGVSVNAIVHKLTPVVLAVAAASVFGVVMAVVQPPAAGQPAGKAPPAKTASEQNKAKTPRAKGKDTIAYSGRVLGPDGKPVPGARLYMTPASGYSGYSYRPRPSPEYATTGADGSFKFAVPKEEFGDSWTVVVATAANHGPGWVEVPADGKRDDLTLRLVPDDVPITGQIVDLEGKPVRGVTLRVCQINAAAKEDLGPWLKAVDGKKGQSLQLEREYLTRTIVALSPKVTTDAEGRFRLIGIGRNRLVQARLDGPTVVSQQLCILTRPGKTIEVTALNKRDGEASRITTYYPASFRHFAAPSMPIVGVVRDKDTKNPLAGVRIESYKMANSPVHAMDIVQVTTDAQGRYRLTGMPKGEGGKIKLVPPDHLPYVPVHANVPDSTGLDPVTVDFELKRGIWIEGKMTDKATGKPLKGAVEYFALSGNPNVLDYPGFDGTFHNIVAAKEDGSYRIVGLPGPGLIGVYCQKEPYLRADKRTDEFGTKESRLLTSPYVIMFTSNYNALAPIDPPKGVKSVKRDVTIALRARD